MKLLNFIAIYLLLTCAGKAEVTPLDQPLPEQTITPITCELTESPQYSEIPVFSSQQDAQSAVGTYHYKLWLPGGYGATPGKQWPCLFVMSPVGNASMGPMDAWLKNNGFIVVLLTDARNGKWPPIIGNFLAAHDDVIKRVRVAEGEKYATGLSGGARASSVFVQIRPGFHGLIMQGAGASFNNASNYNIAKLKSNPNIKLAMTMGNSDSNKDEADRMSKLFNHERFSLFRFDGGHTWAPPELFAKVMAWVMTSSGGDDLGGAGSGGATGDSFDDFFKKK